MSRAVKVTTQPHQSSGRSRRWDSAHHGQNRHGSGRRASCFTAEQWGEIEHAARRVARAYGYGSGWRSPVTQHPEGDAEVGNARLSVAHRGRVVEQAGVAVPGAPVRRQHAWSVHAGIVAMPVAAPNAECVGALAGAGMTGPLWPLLKAYALETISDWYMVEPFLWRALPTRNRVIAGRDAMARIMYRVAATPLSTRARELHVRASDYRQETRTAESVLARWLLAAARMANRHPCPPIQFPGVSQGTGHPAETWWRPPTSGDVFPSCKRPIE